MPLPAISPTGVGTAFKYPTQSTAGVGIGSLMTALPPPTNAPLIFEPGPELTGNHLQLWIVATGPTKDWGGCDVFISSDGSSYGRLGTIFTGAVQGVLTGTFASGADPDTANTLSVDLTESLGQIIAGDANDADDFLTLAYVDGEFIAYSAATLTGVNNYDLDTYIRRGIYESTIASHSAGAPFALAYASYIHNYPANLVGKTIHLKFPAFNSLRGQTEDISTVTAYTYTLTGFGVRSECPVNDVLAAGVKEFDWGTLDSDCTSAMCDWGKITDKLVLCIDMGKLDASGGEYLFAPSVSLAGPLDGGRLPNDGEELFVIELAYSAFLPAELKESFGGCRVAPTADAVFTLQKNNVFIGTATIAAASTVATFSFLPAVSFVPGDTFIFLAPTPQDATLADIWFTFRGSRAQ